MPHLHCFHSKGSPQSDTDGIRTPLLPIDCSSWPSLLVGFRGTHPLQSISSWRSRLQSTSSWRSLLMRVRRHPRGRTRPPSGKACWWFSGAPPGLQSTSWRSRLQSTPSWPSFLVGFRGHPRASTLPVHDWRDRNQLACCLPQLFLSSSGLDPEAFSLRAGGDAVLFRTLGEIFESRSTQSNPIQCYMRWLYCISYIRYATYPRVPALLLECQRLFMPCSMFCCPANIYIYIHNTTQI